MAVTIVIPTYDHAEWLPETIDSALGQADEIIVVDDGSTDATSEVVSAFPVRYHRQPNAGLSAARNTGLELAATDLICFLDSDDTIPPRFIRTLTDAMEAQPPDVAFAYSGVQMFGDDNRLFPPAPWSTEAIKVNNLASATSLFRTAAIGPTRFDSRIRGWEDWEFAVALAARGLRGVPVDACTFNYRKHWDKPSIFDTLGARAANFAKAKRYITRKHRRLYTPGERIRAELDVLKAVGRDFKHRY